MFINESYNFTNSCLATNTNVTDTYINALHTDTNESIVLINESYSDIYSQLYFYWLALTISLGSIYYNEIIGYISYYFKYIYTFCMYFNKIDYIKKIIFKLMVSTPFLYKIKFEKQIKSVSNTIINDIENTEKDIFRCRILPYNGLDTDLLLEKLTSMKSIDDQHYSIDKVSGAVYNKPDSNELTLLKSVFDLYYKTNPLHSDIYPSLITMEKDIIQMSLRLYNDQTKMGSGTITTGGTESIILALYGYREYALKTKHIKNPEVIALRSVHPAFDKGCKYLGIILHKINIDNTNKLDEKMLYSHINHNTILIVGSAPSFPHGLVDNIPVLGSIASQYDIPLHVDACLGGFILPFLGMRRLNTFSYDFSVKGVTSISSDTHKYGCCPKGNSVLLFKDKKMFESCYFIQNDWMGGIYATTNITGSRSGLNLAWSWSILNNIGSKQFTEQAINISNIVIKIREAFKHNPDLFVFGNPMVCVIAFGSNTFSIYELSSYLKKCGWNLNELQNPPSFHLCVTNRHTMETAYEFIKDVNSFLDKNDFSKTSKVTDSSSGSSIYGTTQRIHDPNILDDIVRIYMNALHV